MHAAVEVRRKTTPATWPENPLVGTDQRFDSGTGLPIPGTPAVRAGNPIAACQALQA